MPVDRSLTEQPLVTVIVTCYQQAHLVTQALDSVAQQTERRVQLIVTDDGSSDGSAQVIADWLHTHGSDIQCGATFLPAESNAGLPASLNRALPHIRGRYFVVLNGDDWMDDDRLEVQASALEHADARVGLSYCDMRYVDESGAELPVQPTPVHGGSEGDVLLRMASASFIGMPVAMVRSDVLSTVGPWDESLVADDFDFLLRVAANFDFSYLPRVLLNYRYVESSLTNSRGPALAESRVRALPKFLGRSEELDRAILQRIEDQIVILHGARYRRAVTRRHLRAQLRRRPTRRLARVAMENYLRLPPRSLAFMSLRTLLPGSVMFRHRRRQEFASALSSADVQSAPSWRALSPNPNSAISLLHRAQTLRGAWQPPLDDRIEFLRAMCVGKRVLDIGCVAHDVALMTSPMWLHRHVADAAALCVGVDVDEEGIDAMNRAGFTAVAHDLDRGLGPLASYGPFDVIVAGELVEHVEALGMVFRAANAALGEGGRLVITTPNPYAPWRVKAGQRGVIWENTDHICYFFPGGVAELAERHGLRLEQAMTIDPRPKPWRRTLVRNAKQRILRNQWFLVGWRSTADPKVLRLESRFVRAVREVRPRRRPRFVGETFVYVVTKPAGGASSDR